MCGRSLASVVKHISLLHQSRFKKKKNLTVIRLYFEEDKYQWFGASFEPSP